MIQLSKRQKIGLVMAIACLVAFVVFTLVMAFVNVDQIGVNQFIWQHCGRNSVWEHLTDGLGYLLILAGLGLIVWQIWQWVQRKSLRRIDRNLLCFDVVLAALVLVYIFFEIVVINYRPELENGVAKASYPSSHAMLFATLIPLLIWQVWHYVKNKPLCIVLTVALSILLVIGVVGRLLSGVHWFTDIVAGVLVSLCLVSGYSVITKCQ